MWSRPNVWCWWHWCLECADQTQRELLAWVDYIQSQWLDKIRRKFAHGMNDANRLKRCEKSSQITIAWVENDELKWNFQHIVFCIHTNIMALTLLIFGHSWATIEEMIITHSGCCGHPEQCKIVCLLSRWQTWGRMNSDIMALWCCHFWHHICCSQITEKSLRSGFIQMWFAVIIIAQVPQCKYFLRIWSEQGITLTKQRYVVTNETTWRIHTAITIINGNC